MADLTRQVAVVISFQLDNAPQSIVLDTIEDVTVSSNASVNEQPVVSGDLISDHMYRLPRTMSISGDLSLNGSSNPTSWTIRDDDGSSQTYKGILVTGDGVSLANVQAIFERIQTDGIQCSIFKITSQGDQVRFLQRHNMVLQSITWTERINSLGFSLSFKEAISVEVISYDVDVSDQFLPDISEPKPSNFTDTLIDWSQVDQAFVNQLFSFDLIKQDFWNLVCSLGADKLVAIGVAAGTAVLVASICGGLAAAGPVGWVIIAVAGVAMMAYGIFKTLKKLYNDSKYKIKAFQYYKQKKKQDKEIQRFSETTAGVHNELAVLNEDIQVYQIAEDKAQEVMVNIDGQYYVFTFTRNNTQQTYDCEVVDLENVKVGGMTNVFSAPTNYNDCAGQKPLFNTDQNNYYVYIINVGEENALSNCMIVVSKINPQDYDDVLTTIFKTWLMN